MKWFLKPFFRYTFKDELFFRLSLYSTTKIYVQGSVLYAKLTARSGVAATVRSGPIQQRHYDDTYR